MMKEKRRGLLITAVVLIICGLAFGAVGFAMTGFDVSKLSGEGKMITNEHVINDEFTKIDIDTSTADVIFEASTDGKAKVVCTEAEKRYHEVSVENGTLKIKAKNEKKWYEYIRIFNSVGSQKIVIYLPESRETSETGGRKQETRYTLDQLKIDISTGDVDLQDLFVRGECRIDTSTGKVRMNNVVTGSLDIDVSTGSTTLNETVVLGALKIDSGTGSVTLTRSDAETVKIDTGTGSVNCEFLTHKKIRTNTGTGSVKIPDKTEDGGECSIDTGTGSIKVSYAE